MTPVQPEPLAVRGGQNVAVARTVASALESREMPARSLTRRPAVSGSKPTPPPRRHRRTDPHPSLFDRVMPERRRGRSAQSSNHQRAAEEDSASGRSAVRDAQRQQVATMRAQQRAHEARKARVRRTRSTPSSSIVHEHRVCAHRLALHVDVHRGAPTHRAAATAAALPQPQPPMAAHPPAGLADAAADDAANDAAAEMKSMAKPSRRSRRRCSRRRRVADGTHTHTHTHTAADAAADAAARRLSARRLKLPPMSRPNMPVECVGVEDRRTDGAEVKPEPTRPPRRHVIDEAAREREAQ